MSVDYKARIIYADVIDKVTKTEEAWKDVCRLEKGRPLCETGQ